MGIFVIDSEMARSQSKSNTEKHVQEKNGKSGIVIYCPGSLAEEY
ncbi:hypothetical protein [Gracilibacillus phocaeensis]|nr:hypothetical protein [Gracilibacillus phocaeensis]